MFGGTSKSRLFYKLTCGRTIPYKQ